MTGGVTQANVLGMKRVACASTGNTSASLAAYAAFGDMEGIVFFQDQQIALGKLAQAVAYGALGIQVAADFDRNLELVREVASRLGIYVLNSINPFRLEGQKTIMFETIQQLRWQAPDWIVCPGGNLGNSSAFGKVAIIQAEGANPLYRGFQRGFAAIEPVRAHTVATAIKIGNPVNYDKAIRSIEWTNGVVEQVSDQEIMDAKALIDRQGIGCEPASACSLAGTRKLVEKSVIKPTDTVVGILTGHVLKDPDATIAYHEGRLADIEAAYPNRLHRAEPSIEAISRILAPEPVRPT
jgi:threonine synthase